ncbi:MAG: tRNA pseudouridine(38-40) synthase TruA [Anaerolineales bacterium]
MNRAAAEKAQSPSLAAETAGQVFKAVVEYDGTQYFGFQIQPNAPTIQGELEAALAKVLGEPIRIVGGGRTDAGVHALGQVISFRAVWKHPPAELGRAMNAHLPYDIAVREVVAAPDGFHARFSAVGRRYRYSLFVSPVRSPLRERYAWRLAEEPDVERLAQASALVVGEKDFGAFGEPPWGESTVRCVREAHWSRRDEFLVWDVEANAFLRGMVRTLVSTMVWVGTGRMALEALAELLEKPDRSRVAPPAPASGLCLMEVLY